jgi:daunorubicin resistance ABC transporter ATP-binding subunit
MSDIIKVEKLVEVYPGGTKAIDNVTFNVKAGEFFGFLGPNGAGKSTTINILATLLKKTSGSVFVAGYDIDKGAKEIRKMIGVQSQETILDGDLTGKGNLMFQGHLQRMRGEALEKRANELLGIVGLSEVANKKARQYSGGMKRRLSLAAALVHKPKLIFLDEPTTGLDPQSRNKLWEYLKELNKNEGVTIFLTTQYMDEADKLCDRLAIIDHGQIVVRGSPAELKRKIGGETITLSISENFDVSFKPSLILKSISGVTKVIENNHSFVVYAYNASHLVPEIVKIFNGASIPIDSINFSAPTLDDVFLQHTGRRIRSNELVRETGTTKVAGARGYA